MQGTGESSGAAAFTGSVGEMKGKGVEMKKKLPSPKEMVAHYESKGMEPQEASLKVIDDLQNLLLRVVASTNKNKKKKSNTDDGSILLQLRRLESKLDSKPGYPQTLAIGIASGAVLPHLAASLSHIWNSVRSTSNSSPP